MTEEMVTKYKCDRCGHTEEIAMSQGMFGVKKAKPPASWGNDLRGKVLLCAGCFKDYSKEYGAWFASFMRGK